MLSSNQYFRCISLINLNPLKNKLFIVYSNYFLGLSVCVLIPPILSIITSCALRTHKIMLSFLVFDTSMLHHQVQIYCRGQQVPPSMTLQQIRDQIWCSTEAIADHLLTLDYSRSGQEEPLPYTLDLEDCPPDQVQHT